MNFECMIDSIVLFETQTMLSIKIIDEAAEFVCKKSIDLFRKKAFLHECFSACIADQKWKFKKI